MILLRVLNSGSNGNCYVLENGDHKLVLDCGRNIKWSDFLRSIGWEITQVDGCIYTHIHGDHCGHVADFDKSGIPLFGNLALNDFDRRIIAVPEGQLVRLAHTWRFMPWTVPHTGASNEAVHCYAYYIESWDRQFRMVYMTDFLYSPLTFRNLKCNTILIACNHDDVVDDVIHEKYVHVVSGHSSLNTVDEIVRINKTDQLRNVVLCHLSEDNATPEMMKARIEATVGDGVKVDIARKGMVIELM